MSRIIDRRPTSVPFGVVSRMAASGSMSLRPNVVRMKSRMRFWCSSCPSTISARAMVVRLGASTITSPPPVR